MKEYEVVLSAHPGVSCCIGQTNNFQEALAIANESAQRNRGDRRKEEVSVWSRKEKIYRRVINPKTNQESKS